jgi:hypothetical protein
MQEPTRKAKTRTRLLVASTLTVMLGVTVFLCELAIRLFAPQPSMYPRNQFSAGYGSIARANHVIVHETPGRWRFTYTTNRYGHRGPEVELSNRYPLQNVVVLGDSYTFGIGVNDGEEYATVIQQALLDQVRVVNLSAMGWGLTQEIRRFYELGQLYQPKVVVLEFCANDPSDNVFNEVTIIRDGRFLFQPTTNNLDRFKRYLSNSRIQKSQLYNLLRGALYDRLRALEVAEAMANTEGRTGRVSRAERLHSDLLEAFARDLRDRGIGLVLIAIEAQLDNFPYVKSNVARMESEKLLRYIEVMDWMGGMRPDQSPEGHWGPLTNKVVGQGLAAVLSQEYFATK